MSIRYSMYHIFAHHLEKKALEAQSKNNFEKEHKYRAIRFACISKYEDILTKDRNKLVKIRRKLEESNYASHSFICILLLVIWSNIRVTMQVFWNVIIKKGK